MVKLKSLTYTQLILPVTIYPGTILVQKPVLCQSDSNILKFASLESEFSLSLLLMFKVKVINTLYIIYINHSVDIVVSVMV